MSNENDYEDAARAEHEAQNPNSDIEAISKTEWRFTDDGTSQYQLMSGKVKGENGYIPGVIYENSEWPSFDRQAERSKTPEAAQNMSYEQNIVEPEIEKNMNKLDAWINPDKPVIVTPREQDANLRGVDNFINTAIDPKAGVIENKVATPWAERVDGSQVRLTAAKIRGEEKYMSGFDHVPPGRPMSEVENVWDMENAKHKTIDAAFAKSVSFQKEFQRVNEKDIDMAAEKPVADIIIEGIKNIKDPARQAKAMELAGKMALQSATRKNENDRGQIANRQPRAQEREQVQERSRDRDIEMER